MSTTKQNSRKKNLLTSMVAGAAGVALLAGGASFALWTDSAESAEAAITTGKLSIDATEQTWADLSPDVRSHSNQDIESLEEFQMVPGDIIRIDQTFDVKVEGDHLQAALTVEKANEAFGGDLADQLQCEILVNDESIGLSGSCADVLDDSQSSTSPFAVTSGTFTASVRVSFPKGTELNSVNSEAQMSKTNALTLNSVNFILKQQ